MDNLLKQLKVLQERVSDAWRMLKIDELKISVAKLKEEMNKPDFWSDQERAVKISKQAEAEEKEIKEWEEIKGEIENLEQLIGVAQTEKDDSLANEIENKYLELDQKFKKMEFLVLFSEKYDRGNAILSIHAGTGGVDAQDWAQILERMYLRFAEQKGWGVENLDRTVGSEAGIKSASYRISGRWAYGHLKSENGVHRLVRISPFDAEAMRHTSFALVEVIPEIPEAENIVLKDEDLRIDVFRSSGPGGQSVNTTDSAVRIVHKPTGITVSCQSERSQHQNREAALKVLKSKLFKQEEEKREHEELKMRGEAQKAEWGKQIRSYVMQPYQLVKDHRTDFETADINSVLNGHLDDFIAAYLKENRKNK